MNYIGHLCREIWDDATLTQRQLASHLSISLGKCNSLIKTAEEDGYITSQQGVRSLTPAGKEFLQEFRVRNAVILAAGIDNRFVPFTHETPKGLMEVEGERLIERLIRQLHKHGIDEIYVVVGYLAEKFDYLIDKFNVRLIYNPEYTTKSNLASLYRARHLLGNTYLISSDHWIRRNLFHAFEPESWYGCHWHEGYTSELCATTNGQRRIRTIQAGGRDKLALLGPVFFGDALSRSLVPLFEELYNLPGSDTERWETVLRGKLEHLPLYANILPPFMVNEFANFEELRDFDLSYAEESGNQNLRNIARIFNVPESNITGLTWLGVGMTNQSFLFHLDDKRYIYRIPGEGSENFISRRIESDVYKAIGPLHISDEVAYINPKTGIKISEYLPNSHNVAEDDWESIAECMRILRRLHTSGVTVPHKFDIEKKVAQYEAMCQKVDCIRFEDYKEVRKILEIPLSVIRSSSHAQVLCHIDSVTNNFLVLEDGTLRLLDWEYGGMCHGVADVAMFCVFSNYPLEKYDQLLEWYYGRPASEEERILCLSYAAVAGVLWSLWAEYRQHYGEDFGEYAILMYRTGKDMTTLVRKLLNK